MATVFGLFLPFYIQGATKSAVEAYDNMAVTPEFLHLLSWSSPEFSLDSYNLIFLPGGHEKGVRPLIDSQIMHNKFAAYFPAAAKPSNKTVAAICHGVMVLSQTQGPNGKSVIHECVTTSPPSPV